MKNYFALFVVLVVMACNNTEKQSTESKDTTAATVTKESTVGFKEEKLQKIYLAYINLKDALVAAKDDEAKSAARTLAQELKTYSGCENTSIIASKIETAPDLAEQRKNFTQLSSDIIALFKHAELSSGTIFVQHCPMANDGDGGDWLASEKKIQNPYYGDEMMECGAVISEIKAK